MNNCINIGDVYESKNGSDCIVLARVLDVMDGMVKYEHVSRVKVVFVVAMDDFVREWRV